MKSTSADRNPIEITPSTPQPIKDLLAKHGASVAIKSPRGTKHKLLAQELIAELDLERNRVNAIHNNLNAIHNQYQVTAASVKNLQAAYDEMQRKYSQKLLDLKNDDTDDTDTEGK